jgi:hypothetical protein
MVLDQFGFYEARPGAEFWYDNFWKPRMFSAWIYELVRRLPKLKVQNPKLSTQDLARLRSLPPYPQLTNVQKKMLAAITASQFKAHLPDDMLGDYSSWQEGQSFKLGDWQQIEALDGPAEQDDRAARKRAREYIRRYWRLIYAAWMNMHIPTEMTWFEQRPRHELTDCQLSHKRLAELVRTLS